MTTSRTLPRISRRAFMAISSTALGSAMISSAPAWAEKPQKTPAKRKKIGSKKPNILFVFTDQERFFTKLPATFSFPAHERLAHSGTHFRLHHISSTMCTSSRSVMLTGLQTADTRMFDNCDVPYIRDMSPSIPTLGHLFRKAGYYTAYKGKWHLSRHFEHASYSAEAQKQMDAYGFSDFSSPGDFGAHALGGYHNDDQIAASAISWLRSRGSTLSDEGKPWCLTVSLVNPHDIMYFNGDPKGVSAQDTGKLLMHSARTPEAKWYKNDWKQELPASLRQPLQQPGRPRAHYEFDRAWDYCLGNIPLENENWHRFNNFYLNSMRSVDFHMNKILSELDNLGMSDNTVIVFTADHGECGGHHGLRGKGPFAYKEALHVPFYVVHPDVRGGSSCEALTSHIDIVPSLLGFAGVPQSDVENFAGRELPGKDFSTLLNSSAKNTTHAIRDKVLFTYSGISTNDSEMIRLIAEAKASGKNPKEAIKASGYKPDLSKRGSLRSVFDGRYKFSRYFSPTQRHSPKTLHELFARNDVELFDLKTDPSEMKNLAADPKINEQLLKTMNDKLELAIAEEIGKDDGREMPDFPGIDWTLDTFDL